MTRIRRVHGRAGPALRSTKTSTLGVTTLMIYRKLGIRSRAELGARMGERAGSPPP